MSCIYIATAITSALHIFKCNDYNERGGNSANQKKNGQVKGFTTLHPGTIYMNIIQ